MRRALFALLAAALFVGGGVFIYSNATAYLAADDPAPMPDHPFQASPDSVTPDALPDEWASTQERTGTGAGADPGTTGPTPGARPTGSSTGEPAGKRSVKNRQPTHPVIGGFAPRIVAVPALRIRLTWHSAGIDGDQLSIDRSTAKPTRWNGTGWDAGSQLFAAHVNDRRGVLGPLSRINNARPGMLVFVTDEQGRRHTFKTVSLEAYRKKALPQTVFETTGPPVLHLVTCGGKLAYNPATGLRSHLDNVVLTAVPA